MNRKETIERIQELVATEEINKCLEILRQPITLADFLGWEEDVIYVDNDTNIMYKIQNDNLLEIIGQSLVIDSAYCFSKFSIEELRKFKKQSLKYNLILQSAYRKLFDLQDNEKYLTMNIQDRDVFHSKYSTNNSKYQAQFTLEEIEEIKKKYGIDVCIYNIVEVQE